MTILITLICLILALGIFAGAFYLAEYVVKKQHRVHVLEDAYRESVDQILSLQQSIQEKEGEIEHLKYAAQQNGERMERPRSWNPRDPLNSDARQ